MRYGVLIPAFEPDRRLLDLADKLIASGMTVVVDILGLPAFLMKIMVECLLYTVSFTIQNRLYFS